MQRKPFLSIEDILDIKPSPVRHCCKYSSICHTESRQPSTVDFTDDYLQPSRCSWERPSFVPWHSTACYAGYNAPFPKRNPYLQQYYVAYGTYGEFLRAFHKFSGLCLKNYFFTKFLSLLVTCTCSFIIEWQLSLLFFRPIYPNMMHNVFFLMFSIRCRHNCQAQFVKRKKSYQLVILCKEARMPGEIS